MGTAETKSLFFPSQVGKPHSGMTDDMLLRRLDLAYTMHDFRSTVRDWAAEQTAFPAEVREAARAHTVRDATEAAYFRSDLYEKRRDLWTLGQPIANEKSTLTLSPARK
ncbi:hypothetical protein [Pseudoduganella sp. HUAS MS19]